MNEKNQKEAKLPQVYLIRDEEIEEKPSSPPSYWHRRSQDGSHVAFEGVDIISQIPGDLSGSYVNVFSVDNSFKNVEILNFYNRTYSSSEIQLQIKLNLEGGSTHYLSCSQISMESLLKESTIANGLIKSECCFIPTGNNTLVVKDGKTYNEFISKIAAAKGLKGLGFKDLKSGNFYKLPSSWKDGNLFIGAAYGVTVDNLLKVNPMDSSKISKSKIFLDYAKDELDSIKAVIKKTDQVGLDALLTTNRYWRNPLPSNPKSDPSKKVTAIPFAKNMEKLQFNQLLYNTMGLGNSWSWNPKYYFKSKEDAMEFNRGFRAVYPVGGKSELKAYYTQTYFDVNNIISHLDD